MTDGSGTLQLEPGSAGAYATWALGLNALLAASGGGAAGAEGGGGGALQRVSDMRWSRGILLEP